MLALVLIRHGQSQGNAEGQMEGWGGSSLTETGRQQVQWLAQALIPDGRPHHLYSSPLPRAAETAEGLLAALPPGEPVPLTYCDNLKEYDPGILAGLTWSAAQARYPALCHRLETTPDWLPIPQAEHPHQFWQRTQGFVAHLLAHHGDGERVWVVSHQGVMQHLIAQILGCNRPWGMAMANTARFEFHINRQRWDRPGINRYNSELWRIQRFNDCAHLHSSL